LLFVISKLIFLINVESRIEHEDDEAEYKDIDVVI